MEWRDCKWVRQVLIFRAGRSAWRNLDVANFCLQPALRLGTLLVLCELTLCKDLNIMK